MKQQEVFKKIGIIIKELNEQYDYLVTQNELNDLELELFVANAHFLAEHSEVLRKLNLQNTSGQVTQEKYFEPVVQQSLPAAEPQPGKEENTASPDIPAKAAGTTFTNNGADENPVPHIDLRGDDTGTDYSYVREEPKTIRHELNMDDIPNWEDEEDEPESIESARDGKEPIEETPVESTKSEPVKAIPERIEAEVPDEPLTVNQRISAQLKNSGSRTAEHLNTQPVTDLKQAITLNDKLLYIKDLFNGYNLAYSEAIDILNRFNTFDEAEKFLQGSYVVKNNWESKKATADKFYALLKRRYA